MKDLKMFIIIFSVITGGYSQQKKEISIYAKKKEQKIYIGFKKLNGDFNEKTKKYSSYDENNPNDIWYNKYKLKIIGDSVFVDRSAIFKRGKETFSSASDGGFYFYKGIVHKENNKKIIELEEYDCDYCPKLVVKEGEIPPKPKILIGEITKNGIKIENILFKDIEYSEFRLQSEYRRK